MSRATSVKKPELDIGAATDFAEAKAAKAIPKSKKTSQRRAQKVESKSGLVPEGDARLTSNIRADLHMKLKLEAVRRRTTIGELIEELIDKYL